MPELRLTSKESWIFSSTLEGECSGNIWLFCKALQEQNRRKLAVNLVVV